MLMAALAAACLSAPGLVQAAEPIKPGAQTLSPNLEGQIEQPLRYRPEGADFVIHNGAEFFNRPLYGGHTAFRVDGGDRPEFSLYLPGRGGNLRLGIRTSKASFWLHEASSVTARYRPGEMHYEIADERLGRQGRVQVIAVAYAQAEGLGVEVRGQGLPAGAELVFAYGPGNGQRGRRDGDIGTERVPISEFFQFSPAFAKDNNIELQAQGFQSVGKHATVSFLLSRPGRIHKAPAERWNDLPALLGPTEQNGPQVAVGSVALDRPVHLALQVTARGKAGELDVYRAAGGATSNAADVMSVARFTPAELARRFADARRHFQRLRDRVRIDTPDPYLNAAMGALNVAADAVWDERQSAIMHGAIAWRSKLLGWRGPYALDALGWHDRARRNFDTWTVRQNTSPIPDRLPPPDAASNLARSEAGLHSNGDMSNSHYDMNMVFVDALLRHLLWTGDVGYAKAVWPVLERHLAWERRLFRREYGPKRLPLYEAYAAIWASDDMYYNGGGVAYASAYNAWHHEMAARIARLIGQDDAPYQAEANAIRQAMREVLWMPQRGAFAEYRDLLGRQLLHPSYGLWSFYHTMDSRVPTAAEASAMAADLDRHLRPIPVKGPGVPADRPYRMLPSSNWMPYTWSINNVVMGENLHTALAYWQAGRSETAYELAKGSLLASLYMGITPGNIGSMNYLDVYRRESQRDFADGSGVMSRALVEGLFGVQPDALSKRLALRPGFPADWSHASLAHPDVSLSFRRNGKSERWTVGQAGKRFERLALYLPEPKDSQVKSVKVNGQRADWAPSADAAATPRIYIELPFPGKVRVDVHWAPRPTEKVALQGPAPVGGGKPAALEDRADAPGCSLQGPGWLTGEAIQSSQVDMGAAYNDRVTQIFKQGKYQSPRSPHVSLSLPAQGIGAWAGHVNEMAVIDDTGLRAQGGTLRLPNGLSFSSPSRADAANVMFTSQWDNYPREASVPLAGQARRVFLLMAGSTNAMQSRIDNGEVIVAYADGSEARMALRNPDNWWPIEQDYFADDYQFPYCGSLPVRVDLKTAKVHVLDPAGFKGKGRGKIEGGAASVLQLPLDPAKPLKSLTVRALANDVVIGLMAVTLDKVEAGH
jgi:hypothetical protein